MLAKKTAKNQITLPKSIVDRLPKTDYFEVSLRGEEILLRPVVKSEQSAIGGFMDRAIVTMKGQIVIPSKLRRKFGIKKGTQVYVYERDGEIAIKPITDDYIRNMAGIAGTKGKLLKALMVEKAKEREL